MTRCNALILTAILIAAPAAYAAAEPSSETWVVDSSGHDVAVRFHGQVIADRRDMKGVLSPSRGNVIVYRAPDGARLAPGEAIRRYDSTARQARLTAQQANVWAAEAAYAKNVLVLEQGAIMEEQDIANKTGQLRIREVAQQQALHVDELKVELLKRELDAAAQANQRALADLADARAMFREGQLSRERVQEKEIGAKRAELALTHAQVKWRLAIDKVDRIAARLEALEIQALRLELGLEDAVKDAVAGKTAALAGRLEGQKRQLQAERERVAERFQRELRDCYDHTPVTSVIIRRVDGTDERRFDFQPTTHDAAASHTVDHGAVYERSRGFGWEQDIQVAMLAREGAAPDAGVAVVRQRAGWRCDVANGEWEVTVRIGDSMEWRGAVVRVAGEVVAVANRLDKGVFRDIKKVVHVTSGTLELTFGSGYLKSQLAEHAGVVSYDNWAPRLGDAASGWRSWPTAYVTDSSKLKIRAKFTNADSELLRAFVEKDGTTPSETPNSTAALRQHLAAQQVTVRLADGRHGKAKITNVRGVQVPFSSNSSPAFRQKEPDPQDAIAREVDMAVSPEIGGGLRLNTKVSGAATITIPSGFPWVPLQFVRRTEQGFAVATAKGPKVVSGVQVQQVLVMLPSELPDGKTLHLPATTDGDEQELRFDGQVIPGERTTLVCAAWGRVAELVPDGSMVEEGQQVVLLKSDWVESRRKDRERRRKRAEERYLEAAEERRLKAAEANLSHRRKVIAEKRARLKARPQDLDPVRTHALTHRWQESEIEQQRAKHSLQNAISSGLFSKAKLSFRQTAAELSDIETSRAYLNLVHHLRSPDWLVRRQAQLDWQGARAELGLRELELRLSQQEQAVARIKAKLKLDEDTSDGRWQEHFKKARVIRAPVAGRVFFLRGYNPVTRQSARIDKESEVWRGLEVAEILQMDKMAFEVELPETFYRRAADAKEVTIRFPKIDGLELRGTIQELGRRLYIPKDLARDEVGQQALSSRKVFKAVFAIQPPPSHHDRFLPGLKGQVIFQ